MKWFQQHTDPPADGQARALAQPVQLDGYFESQATHLVWSEDAGDYVYAVVENCGGRDYYVPAMRVYTEDQGE